jgi:hypothetical protein
MKKIYIVVKGFNLYIVNDLLSTHKFDLAISKFWGIVNDYFIR